VLILPSNNLDKIGSNNDSSRSSGALAEDDLTCSTNVGDGVFGNPIQVSISCTATADIRYCIDAGSCCDPESSGISYTAPIVIGAESGDYCLSFFGETASFKFSNVTQQLPLRISSMFLWY
jgi:hypothetical protein